MGHQPGSPLIYIRHPLPHGQHPLQKPGKINTSSQSWKPLHHSTKIHHLMLTTSGKTPKKKKRKRKKNLGTKIIATQIKVGNQIQF